MADEGSADTFEYTLAGRTLTFYKTGHGQLLMLERLGRSIMAQMQALGPEQLDKVKELGTKLNDMAFEVAESRFTNPEDLEFVRMEVLRGNITEVDIFRILANGVVRTEVDDDADPVTAKRVKKAPAKKAPASRRGTR